MNSISLLFSRRIRDAIESDLCDESLANTAFLGYA
jgi:hypothetical protein